jgi:hypothetical protein
MLEVLDFCFVSGRKNRKNTSILFQKVRFSSPKFNLTFIVSSYALATLVQSLSQEKNLNKAGQGNVERRKGGDEKEHFKNK